MKIIINLLLISFFFMQLISCSKKPEQVQQQTDNTKQPVTQKQESVNVKVTFVELGSVNCIPCRQMQPVMRSIEEKYKGQVKVVFHDVWKDKAPAQKYGIQLIPTQVFLDETGNEFFRHEGFFPEAEIEKLLETKGLKSGI